MVQFPTHKHKGALFFIIINYLLIIRRTWFCFKNKYYLLITSTKKNSSLKILNLGTKKSPAEAGM